MLKRFALFLFNDEKREYERYLYIKDVEIEADNVEQEAKKLFVDYLFDDYNIYEISETLKATTLDVKVTINGVKFQAQTNAYIPKASKSIVLAERIQKTAEQKKNIPCAYCEGSGDVPASENENETEVITCIECNGTGEFNPEGLKVTS